MSLRDDVRWVCETADGLLSGWLPGRLPKWETKEGEKLGWLVLLLWQKFYDAAMARISLEAEVRRLQGDVDGLRETNERLTDLLDQPKREHALAALAATELKAGYYWVQRQGLTPEVAWWGAGSWWFPGSDREAATVDRVLSGRIPDPGATNP